MNNLVRWEQYAPVSLGLEETFRRLDAFADRTASENYPKYNIIKIDETTQRLEIALAGFKKEDIEVSVERGVLNITATHKELEVGSYVHKGIASRDVRKNWQLSDNAVVDDPVFVDGMLKLTIRLEVPEEHKRKVLPIS